MITNAPVHFWLKNKMYFTNTLFNMTTFESSMFIGYILHRLLSFPVFLIVSNIHVVSCMPMRTVKTLITLAGDGDVSEHLPDICVGVRRRVRSSVFGPRASSKRNNPRPLAAHSYNGHDPPETAGVGPGHQTHLSAEQARHTVKPGVLIAFELIL